MDLMIANTHLGCQLSYTQFDNFSQFLTLSFLHILSYTHIQTNILILLPIIIYICMHDSDRWYKFCVCDRVSRNFGYLQTHSRNFEELERGCNFHFFFFLLRWSLQFIYEKRLGAVGLHQSFVQTEVAPNKTLF